MKKKQIFFGGCQRFLKSAIFPYRKEPKKIARAAKKTEKKANQLFFHGFFHKFQFLKDTFLRINFGIFPKPNDKIRK